MSPPPERVRVTRTRRNTQSEHPRTVREEIAGESRLGATYVSSLMRAQLQLTLGVLAAGLLTLGALPLIYALVPPVRSLSALGLPIAWAVLGVVVYPVIVLVARWYTRSAERLEAEFNDLVRRR
ncbi:hypothetical protein [Janibacter cremeus]|uniref:DUF485 domain-containing protein n=1 Tax=Janibacter cremeus TaxID=1285192 RepID=A0A852VVQ1_9MICO|nr:hypothetical protein [Janibacter cremeus]NYF98733.1 hypothetical protein [Janibacter cremeus]